MTRFFNTMPRAADVIAACVCLVLLSAPVMGDETGRYVKTSDGTIPRPRIAVDNVCAWPNLTTLNNGEIVATLFNQPSHGSLPGDVECWATADGGRTWEKRGTPARHEPDTNRMNVAAGRATNGDLIVISSGWSNRYPSGKSGAAFRSRILPFWICRSSDGGRSWNVERNAKSARSAHGFPGIPFGDIVPGDDGLLRMAVYCAPKEDSEHHRAFVLESKDDGRTWGSFHSLDPANLRNETALLNLGGDKWLAAARNSALFLYRSTDACRTWQQFKQPTSAGQHPGHLLRLKDGRILLSYGNRTGNPHAVEVRTSDDEGQSWSQPLRVVDWHGDGGYPSSVQLPDGLVLTAYYARKIKGHDRYHMGAVTWDPSVSWAGQ